MPVTTIYIQGLIKARNIHLTSIFRKGDWRKKRSRVPASADWTWAAYGPAEQIKPVDCMRSPSVYSTVLSLLPRKPIVSIRRSDVSLTEKDKYSALTRRWRNQQNGVDVTKSSPTGAGRPPGSGANTPLPRGTELGQRLKRRHPDTAPGTGSAPLSSLLKISVPPSET